ncbi:hypothetical protein [Intestinibacter bartlettii]|uniref:hypothetical protein n=1 Tax=Intestinibacter bartlettii TaxID=261299 RepID=UPI00082144A5|nr:hypothetical protein [Intestinibacter bartlettii]SCI37456.1 Uncharacterised protein [uncultured Clostridium sp.]
MKRRLVQEGLIYCILPVIAIGVFYNQYRGIPWMILGVGFLYTFYTKRREDRINYTFLTFLILFNTYYIMTNNIKGDILIQFNLGFVIFISIAILLLEAMDFSICKIAFQDILMMLGESKMGVYKVSKKSKVDLNLKKLSTIIILELLCCDLIGIYYINIKNITNLSYMISYEILVIIIFTLVEMYQLSLIRSKVKYIKYKNKKLIKEKVDLGKVINLEQYR